MRNIQEVMVPNEYLPVAAIAPEVSDALDALREESWSIIDNRRLLMSEGRHELIPPTIDALSTADSAWAMRRTFGEASKVYAERRLALDLDCLRLVKEWNRKLKPEYFGELRHHFSQPDEEFFSHGLAVGQMTLNALRPIPESTEEESRRVNERVEDKTPIIIQKVGGFALAGVGIRTISQCTDKAIEDFETDIQKGNPHDGYDGYVPEVEKDMIRDIRIDPVTGDRIQEQVAVVGKYSLTHTVFQEALRRKGFDASGLDKTALHGTQLLVQDSLQDFVKLLDEVAMEEWCVPIFMGERVDEYHPRDYDAFWNEAEQREEDLTDLAGKTASFIMELADDPTFDRRKAPGHVEGFVKQLLLEEAKRDIAVAHHAFGAETAQGITNVVRLEQLGRYEEARDLMKEVEQAAPGGGYCSGGSCGLEGVDLHSEEGKLIKDKLKADGGDTVVKDKERACKCGKKEIYYAYTASKVTKYCGSCQAFESKNTKGGK